MKLDDALMTSIKNAIQDGITKELRKIVDDQFPEIAVKITSQVAARVFGSIDMRMREDRIVIDCFINRKDR